MHKDIIRLSNAMIDPETINDLETACEVIRQLVRRLEALERAVGELRGKLEEARREGPFSKGTPKDPYTVAGVSQFSRSLMAVIRLSAT